MTDFEKLLEGGCIVNTLIYISSDIDIDESWVLSALVTHLANHDSDSTNLGYSSKIDLTELIGITEMDKEDVIDALNSLEEKGYIAGDVEFGEIEVHLKAYNLTSKAE